MHECLLSTHCCHYEESAVLQQAICDPSWSMGQNRFPKIRKDGWTPERQLRFLDVLARTRSVTRAAAAPGMSREGAYRLLNRNPDSLFAALWDLALAPHMPNSEVHIENMSGGRLMRLLGNHYRRKRGDFLNIGMARTNVRAG